MARISYPKHSRRYNNNPVKSVPRRAYKGNEVFTETIQDSKYSYARIAGYKAKEARQPRMCPDEYNKEEAKEWHRGYNSFDPWKRIREQA